MCLSFFVVLPGIGPAGNGGPAVVAEMPAGKIGPSGPAGLRRPAAEARNSHSLVPALRRLRPDFVILNPEF